MGEGTEDEHGHRRGTLPAAWGCFKVLAKYSCDHDLPLYRTGAGFKASSVSYQATPACTILKRPAPSVFTYQNIGELGSRVSTGVLLLLFLLGLPRPVHTRSSPSTSTTTTTTTIPPVRADHSFTCNYRHSPQPVRYRPDPTDHACPSGTILA